MIHLVTGLPGHGKTLWTLWYYKRKSEEENRPVYYFNISELTLPWHQLDNPEKWFECEANAIIIIDEAQKVFRPAASGAGVPEFIAKLETHRHGGIDIVLITQMPMLIHKNVRMLTGRHNHIVRFFGANNATVHEWPECRDNPKQRKDSQSSRWFYPKEVYGYYKSAEVHTVKRSIPLKFYLIFLMPIVALVLAYVGYRMLQPVFQKPGQNQEQGMPAGGNMIDRLNNKADGVSPGQSSDAVKPMTKAEYIAQYQPRIADVQYSAPAYDQVTKPVTAPYPAACVASSSRCTCYTQQGTRLNTSDAFCRNVVTNGYFVDWQTKPPGEQAQQPPQQAPQQQVVSSDAQALPPVGWISMDGSVETKGNFKTKPKS